MSEEGKARQEERRQQEQPKTRLVRNVLTAALIFAAFAGAYYLGIRKRKGRLDAFAKCLAAKQAKMYGTYWCPHCADQKEMFGTAFQYVPYVECGIQGSRQPAPVCVEAGIQHFPTWQFADGERREGTQPLPALREKTGCGL